MNSSILVLLLGMAGLLSAADNWIASLLLPNISSYFDINISKASLILTAYLIPYGIMQPIYGYYGDKHGKKKMLLTLVFLLSLSTLLCAASANIYWLITCRFITGFFAAGIITSSLGLLGEFYNGEKLIKQISIFLGLLFLGQGLSAGIGGWLIEIFNWRALFLLFSLLALLSCLSLLQLPSSSLPKGTTSLLHSLANLLKKRDLLMIYLLAFCNGFVVLGNYSFLGSYLSNTLQISYTDSGLCLMLFGIVCFSCGMLNRTILKKLSSFHTLIIGFFCSLLALLLLNIPHFSDAIFGIVLLGIGYVLVQSVLASQAMDMAAENKGLSSGLVGVGIFGGGGIGTLLLSTFLPNHNYPFIFLLSASFVIIPLICTALLKNSLIYLKSSN
ncbi:MAG: MFS transporter [Psychromonas sp.]|nr:MFS transporter [Psychromonas sp.]